MAAGTPRLSSTMTRRACSTNEAELPTDMVGTMPPSSVMAAASTMAMSMGPIWPARNCSTVSDKCWSTKAISPWLILRRSVVSTWNGMRRARTPACASSLSVSCPSEAPVSSVMRSGSAAALSASAAGTDLQSPARVNSLMPTVMPSWTSRAASWGKPTGRAGRDGEYVRDACCLQTSMVATARSPGGIASRLLCPGAVCRGVFRQNVHRMAGATKFFRSIGSPRQIS